MLRSKLERKFNSIRVPRYPINLEPDDDDDEVLIDGEHGGSRMAVDIDDMSDDPDFVIDTNPAPMKEFREISVELPPKESEQKKKGRIQVGSSGLGCSYLENTKQLFHESAAKLLQEKAVITPDMGAPTNDPIPSAELPDIKLRKLRKEERSKSKGPKWYDLPASELTEERKRDLEVLRNIHILDPKRFYKKPDLRNVLPKYFQFGKVLDNPLDFYSSRIPKKQRKRTIVEELLADPNFNQYRKRKMEEIHERIRRKPTKAEKHAKRLKKKKR